MQFAVSLDRGSEASGAMPTRQVEVIGINSSFEEEREASFKKQRTTEGVVNRFKPLEAPPRPLRFFSKIPESMVNSENTVDIEFS